MKAFRSTLILAAVFAALFGYIYFVELKKPTTPGGEEAKPKLFSVAADKISEITVKSAAGERTELKKGAGGWEIVQPVQATADATEVGNLTTALATTDVQRVVDENPSDLKQYGLAEPRVDVAFKTTDGKGHQLLIGDKTPTGADLYAKVPGDKKVVLVPAALESTFNRSTFDLRDKTVLKFDRNKVDAVSLASGASGVQMAKTGEDWALKEPVAARADYGSVEGLIGRLQTAQMKALVSTDPKDVKEYGLDKPETKVTVRAGSAQSTLEIGKKTAEGTYYARDSSRPAVFTVEGTLVDELKKPADDYRRKDVFEFRPYNATRIEVTRGTETLVFEKVKGPGKDATEKWRQVAPAARDIDPAKMDTFLTKLTNMRVQSWAPPSTKPGASALTVVAKYDDGNKQDRATFSKNGTDVYAARASEPGAAKVDATEFDDALKALDALK
ncbi:MAG: DUF4340 domain-containing protein [Bacteroidales bacterium]